MKRIIAFLLTASMLCANLAVTAFAEKESEDVAFKPGMEYKGNAYEPEEEVKYSENSGSVSYTDVSDYSAVGILGMLNIMTAPEEGKFKPNMYISRAEFVEGVLKAFKVRYEGAEFGKDGSFYDVDKDHPQYSAIASALSAGFISGYENNSFKPDDVMSYEEAIACLMKAIGYSGRAGDNVNAARSALTKKISVKEPKAITRMEMARLLYNALDMSVRYIPQFSSVGLFKYVDDEFFDKDDDYTIMTHVWDIHKSEGLLSANYIETIDDNSAEEGTVVIAGIRYVTKDLNNLDWLGMYVDYYYNTDGELIYMNKSGKVDELVVKADDIISFDPSSRVLTYYDEKGRKERAELSSEYKLFYNDKKPTGFYGKEIFNIEEGQVRLVANKNSKYTYAFIEEYKNFVLNKVDKDTAQLDFKLGENKGHFIVNTYTTYIAAYDGNFSRKEIYRETEEGKSTLDSSVFKSNSVISIYAPYGSYDDNGSLKSNIGYLKIVCAQNPIKGKITGTVSKKDKTLTIDGKEYSVSKSSYLEESDMRMGTSQNFLADFSGKLVAVSEDTSDDEWEIAYLVHITYGDLQEYISELTLYDTYGSFGKVPVSDNLRINGKKMKSGEAQTVLKNSAALLGKPNLVYQQPIKVKYTGNDDNKKIAEIQTVLADYSGKPESWIKREASGNYVIYNDSNAVICEGGSYTNPNALYNRPTYILTVPDTEMKDERYFSNSPINNSGGTINLDIYNVDENLKPQLAIKYASGAQDAPIKTGDNGGKPVMLKESWRDLGDADMPILRFSVAQAKGVVEYWSEDVNILDDYIAGDMIWLYGNGDKVTKVTPLTYNGKVLGPRNLPTDMSYTEPLNISYSGMKIYAFQPYRLATADYLVMQNGPIVKDTKRAVQYLGVTRILAAMQGGMQIYEEKNGKTYVGQATLDQCRTAQEYGDDASILIAWMHEGGIKQLLVYNLDMDKK